MSLTGNAGGGWGSISAAKMIEDLGPIENWAAAIMTAVIVFAAASGLAPAIAEFAAGKSNDGMRALLAGAGIGLVVALASAVLGALLGFLFGIPRSLQRGGASPQGSAGVAAADGRSFRTNTSFEEISDWLTKIVIGIGLIQFNNIIQYIYIAAKVSAYYISGSDIPGGYDDIVAADSNFAAPYLFALIVISLFGSTLFCYLETRTRLALLFVGAEKNLSVADGIALGAAADRPAVTAPGAPGKVVTANATTMDEKVANLPLAAITDPKERAGWATAQIRTGGDRSLAMRVLKDAARQDPDDTSVQKRFAEALTLEKNFKKAAKLNAQLASAAIGKERIELEKNTLFNALYVKSDASSIERAVRSADELIRLGQGSDPMVQVWRAAAYGQLHSLLKERDASTQEIGDARNAVLEAIRELARIRPDDQSTERVLVRGMLEPGVEGTSPDDNDLVTLATDKEIRAAAGFKP